MDKTFKPGDRVVFTDGVRPEYLAGVHGTVIGPHPRFCPAWSVCADVDMGLDKNLQFYGDELSAVTVGILPARQMLLPTDPTERKALPITTGVLDYFPLALAYISAISKQGNDQHNPGQPLHWDKSKSKDHADCIARHLIDRGTYDTSDSPPLRHSGKLAWRALALLETELGNGTTP